MAQAKKDGSMRELMQLTAAMFLAATLVVMATDRARPAGACFPKAEMLKNAKEHKATWHEASNNQYQFLRGIYALSPTTPPGLPYGTSAGWLTLEGNESGWAFFIDDDQACTPMPVPKQLLEMLDDIRSGKIHHQGKAL